MKLGTNNQDSLAIFEKTEDWTIDFGFYHSQDRSLRYRQLVQTRNESSKTYVLTVRLQWFGIPLNDTVFPLSVSLRGQMTRH
jgi:hypothetical protein